MPRILLSLVLFLVASSAGAESPELAKARMLWLSGKYAEAADLYRPAAGKSPEAALGLARCHEAQGRTDEAVKVLTPLAEKRPVLQAELSRLAFDRGEVSEAARCSDEALRLDRDQVLARYIQAELARTSGRLDEAQRGYRGLIELYNDERVKQAEDLCWVGRAAAEYARWNRLSDQFDFLVNELYPDVLKLDAACWQAHYDSGMLFLEKYNEPEATKEFKAALKLNPQAAEVHAALAAIAMGNHDLDQAEASLRRALEINPRLLDAWHLKADLAWANFQPQEALRLLEEKARPINPIDEDTLGRIAACYLMLDGVNSPRPQTVGWVERSEPHQPSFPRPEGEGGHASSPRPRAGEGQGVRAAGSAKPSGNSPHPDPLPEGEGERRDRFSRLVSEVTHRNAHAGEFFFSLAAMLAARNKQAEAEQYLREAIRVMPRQVGPHAELGLLLMHTGREDEARKLLAEAFEADPFHVRVKNTLEVLDVLDKMTTVRTEHFVLRHAKADRLLGRYAARYLEKVHGELCKEFGYRPPGTTVVEIFNRAEGHDGHAWFSARMVGLPYLGTVGASTGRIIAMTSPEDGSVASRFNWARVLRHEMVHVITLQQTRFNIPHWFTEGLAVRSEDNARPQRWNALLDRRAAEGKLFNLETINRGFSRPMSGDDCQLAYCQAELYVEYMVSLGGPAAVQKLLAAYTETAATPEAIRRGLGVPVEQFERGYVEFVKKEVAAAAARAKSEPSLEDLRKARREKPDDADLAARLAALDEDDHPSRRKLAELALARRDAKAAARWAAEALEIHVTDPQSHRLLAEALAAGTQYAAAIEEYETAIELDPAHLQQRLALADACVQAKQPERARQVLEELLKRSPNYPGAGVLLESLKEKH